MALSFETDIMPIFKQYQQRMIWRFDLTDYTAVTENALLIQEKISSIKDKKGVLQPPAMPPPPFPPLTAKFIQTYNNWVAEGCRP